MESKSTIAPSAEVFGLTGANLTKSSNEWEAVSPRTAGASPGAATQGHHKDYHKPQGNPKHKRKSFLQEIFDFD